MAQMKRGNSNGRSKASKGQKAMKMKSFGHLFKPASQGISANGMPNRVESVGEAKDRRLG
jgi:hypothetical protein